MGCYLFYHIIYYVVYYILLYTCTNVTVEIIIVEYNLMNSIVYKQLKIHLDKDKRYLVIIYLR